MSNGRPQYLTAVGNTLFFTADDGIHGRELWESDGTETGTVMVKDINSGAARGHTGMMIVVGNGLYFSGDDGVSGKELWKLLV